MAKAILFDSTKCTACRGCQVACKQWNNLEADETVNTGTYENPPDLSSRTWLKMIVSCSTWRPCCRSRRRPASSPTWRR